MFVMLLIGLVLVLVAVLGVATAGEEDIPVREATAKRRHKQIALDKLDFDVDGLPDLYYCHRADVKNGLKALTDSMVREGQAEAIQVWQKADSDRYLVIAGHRRVMALRDAAEQKLDSTITLTMTVECVIISANNKADLLVCSLATNAQRQDLSQLEILAAVKKLRDAGVSNPRGASAVGLQKSQYERHVAIVENEQIHQHVVDGNLGLTKASRIIEAVQKAAGNGHSQTLDGVLQDFANWCEERRAEIEAARETYEAAGKKLPEAMERVDSHLTADLFKQWIARVEKGESILGEAGFNYGVLLDEKKGKLTIPGLSNLDLRTAKSSDLLKIVAAVVSLPRKLAPFVKQAEFSERMKAVESVAAVDPDFEDFLQGAGLEHRVEEFKRAAEAAHEAEAGEAVNDGGHPERPAKDVAKDIDVKMRKAGAKPPAPAADDAEDDDA